MAAAGAHGFLDKSVEAGALLAAIRAVHTEQLVFPARLRVRPPAPSGRPAEASHQAAEVLLRLHQLSARERKIIALVRVVRPTAAISCTSSACTAWPTWCALPTSTGCEGCPVFYGP
ncbi:MAG: response regulator transcription factor [Hymenobacter sp.]|nr:MAG: response regulator transcription factor [Hymenobacter sp.]